MITARGFRETGKLQAALASVAGVQCENRAEVVAIHGQPPLTLKLSGVIRAFSVPAD